MVVDAIRIDHLLHHQAGRQDAVVTDHISSRSSAPCLNIYGGAPYANGQHLVVWGCYSTDNMRFHVLDDGRIRNPRWTMMAKSAPFPWICA